jgi:hypothetical protein
MVYKSSLSLRTLAATLLTVFLVGPFTMPTSAHGQVACEKRAKITTSLKKDYAEMPASAGLDNAGRMIEVFASTEGSWTILMTMPTGVSCLLATGENWMRREIKNIKESGARL